jgi:hypothetical protein
MRRLRTLVMRIYLAATFVIAIAIGLAPALDLGVAGKFSAAAAGGKSGGSPGNSSGGAAKAGASTGAKAGSNSGASGKSHGTSSGSGGGAASSKGKRATPVPSRALPGLLVSPGSRKSSVTPKSVGAGAIVGIAPAQAVPPSIRLPLILWPTETGPGERGEYKQGVSGYPVTDPMTTGAISGDSSAVVRVCLQAIASAALPLGAVRIRAASAGPFVSQRDGALTAPIAVRIDYAGQGGIEVRRARVRCHLDSNGMVIAVN